MGSVGVLCEKGRSVWCELGDLRCESARLAVAEVNQVIPGLLIWQGEASHDDILQHYHNGDTVFLPAAGVPKDHAALPIAMTLLKPEASQACIGGTPILILWDWSDLTPADWNQVALHELLHSLGAGHAAADCPFSTVMRPAVEGERRVGLSKSDRNWLRAVYGV